MDIISVTVIISFVLIVIINRLIPLKETNKLDKQILNLKQENSILKQENLWLRNINITLEKEDIGIGNTKELEYINLKHENSKLLLKVKKLNENIFDLKSDRKNNYNEIFEKNNHQEAVLLAKLIEKEQYNKK